MREVVNDMRSETRGRPVDLAIADLADRQHGVLTRRQLAALGVGAGSIQHRLAVGRLHRVHRGVFAVGRRRLAGRGRWMAAVLASGAGALLSHRSAAALWGIAGYSGVWIDVTAPGTRRRRRDRIVVHGGVVVAEDRELREGIPVTSVARVLLDLADVIDEARLARAVEEAERKELLDFRALERLCKRSNGRRGLGSLQAVLADLRPLPETRSELERRFVALCRRAHLPLPAINHVVEGLEVDAAWMAERLIVELDGYAFHKGRHAFERDRARDAALQLAGYRVLRLTSRRLADEPAAIVEEIGRLLGDRL